LKYSAGKVAVSKVSASPAFKKLIPSRHLYASNDYLAKKHVGSEFIIYRSFSIGNTELASN